MTTTTLRRTGLALLTAAALFGAGQVMLLPLRVNAQTPEQVPVAAATLSATGIGQVSGTSVESAAGALMMSIEERSSGTDVQGAVKTVQARLAKMRAALVAAGVADASIHLQGFNIGPNYGYAYPMPAVDPASGGMNGAAPPFATDGMSGGMGGATTPSAVAPSVAPSVMPRPVPPPAPTGYMVNAQLGVDTNGPEQLATAMRVAIDNGATNVNSYMKGVSGNPTPPDSSKLAPAIRQATAQAKVMAQASAEAAGVTLGDISSITVLAPTPSYNGGPSQSVSWQVQVRVTYALK
ncbi:MAG: SIMPL domain-containing protein [Chloroflexota bacterium]